VNDRPPKPPRRPELSEEDAALWAQVVASVEPARGKARALHHGRKTGPEAANEGPAPFDRASAHLPASTASRAIAAPLAVARRAGGREDPPVPAGLDRRKARRIARGQLTIDGRLDLHGMTEAEAHARLVSFLRHASARGARLVLVVTGKGGMLEADREPWLGAGMGMGRGVLRRNVPRWLAEPELAALVVGVSPAAVRHGGGGALYVQLRALRPAGGRS
jgi:DNA-nicking Smr family endonuclease